MSELNGKNEPLCDTGISPDLRVETGASMERDILIKEKEISEENIKLLRERFKNERALLEKNSSQKDSEILKLRSQIEQLNNKLASILKQLDFKESFEAEQVKKKILELESMKRNEEKRWQEVLERVKYFQNDAERNQSLLFVEQEKQLRIKKEYIAKEGILKSEIAELSNMVSNIKETGFRKEEGFLREIQLKNDKLHILEERCQTLEQEFSVFKSESEHKYQSKFNEAKKLESAIQETAIGINNLRNARDEALANLSKAEATLKEYEVVVQKNRHEHETETIELKKQFTAEQENWFKAKQKLILEYEAAIKAVKDEYRILETSKETVEVELADKRVQNEGLIKTLELKENEITGLNQANKALAFELNAKIDNEREKLTRMRNEFANEMDAVKNEHRIELESLLKKNNELKKQFEDEKSELSKYAELVKVLNQKISCLESEILNQHSNIISKNT